MSATANAAITFDGVTGAFPGVPCTEVGFTVTATQGTWVVGNLYGNPVPSIFVGPIGPPTPSIATIEVTGGTFAFTGLDVSSNNGPSTYSFTGFLGLAQVYSLAGAAPAEPRDDAVFINLTALASGTTAVMDRLVITITPSEGVTSVNIDNIAVTPATVAVPEPAAVALLSFGLPCLAAARRHKTA